MFTMLSWIMILLGLALPVIAVKYTPKYEVFFMMFLVFLLTSVSLMVMGTYLNPWVSYHEEFWKIIFYICLTEITLSSLYYIYFTCKRGIQFIISTNPWDVLGIKFSLFIRIFLIPLFLLLPSLIFSCLYAFWNILSENSISIGAGDAFYYGLTVVFAIPQTGLFQEFQHSVNSDIILRIIQVTHVVISKFIEFIVIGFIIGQIRDMIKTNESNKSDNKVNRRAQHFRNRRHRIRY
ncbi:hypothetical protein [Paenibacillus sp. FSL H8-0259]|jgi:hypothetical protein|uniref:hypothetical protein n=1 Tax=Paenibacillus sp. FSL H8-0259 TaxID=1920423 RepID=UPI00096C33F7|nr:hypothetical protein [Paenibacillus sp. FSL H8-0259]OMF24615.1 hypothetical protein BK132_23455 [Paenibacillus sp. FSL H8-0259]